MHYAMTEYRSTERLTPPETSAWLTTGCFLAPARVLSGTVSSRSGYEAAENRQNGADAPIFSLLRAI